MGTPCKTQIYDEDNNLLLSFYRQSDGYPHCHGKELMAFCAGYKIVNGLRESDPKKVANGMGDFAAQCLMHFKMRSYVGQIYVLSQKTIDEWHSDFTYSVLFCEGQLIVEMKPDNE